VAAGIVALPVASTNVLVDGVTVTSSDHPVTVGGTATGLILDELNY